MTLQVTVTYVDSATTADSWSCNGDLAVALEEACDFSERLREGKSGPPVCLTIAIHPFEHKE